jgi:hypothetical protein
MQPPSCLFISPALRHIGSERAGPKGGVAIRTWRDYNLGVPREERFRVVT